MSIKTLYTTKATATGGREGTARSDDGALDVKLSTPKALGGAGGTGTNPEQLFAAGYAACFLSALKMLAGQDQVPVPADAAVTATVGIGAAPDGGFGLAVELSIALPGVDSAKARQLVDSAHKVCPYSNATRGNVEVSLTLA